MRVAGNALVRVDDQVIRDESVNDLLLKWVPAKVQYWRKRSSNRRLPPSLYTHDVLLDHGWPPVVEGARCLRKREQNVELGANVAHELDVSLRFQHLLEKHLHDFDLAV
jgi:hypothetical protein